MEDNLKEEIIDKLITDMRSFNIDNNSTEVSSMYEVSALFWNYLSIYEGKYSFKDFQAILTKLFERHEKFRNKNLLEDSKQHL